MGTETHPAALESDALLGQCESRRTRRSGPGGQHRNKVETAVILVHQPTGVRAEANERRSQAENRRAALFRLRKNLALGVRRPWTSPSPAWRARCQAGRLRVAADHADFPTLLAEALDALAEHHGDVTTASKLLECTASQLVKFLKTEPQALAQLNDQRRLQGQRPLR